MGTQSSVDGRPLSPLIAPQFHPRPGAKAGLLVSFSALGGEKIRWARSQPSATTKTRARWWRPQKPDRGSGERDDNMWRRRAVRTPTSSPRRTVSGAARVRRHRSRVPQATHREGAERRAKVPQQLAERHTAESSCRSRNQAPQCRLLASQDCMYLDEPAAMEAADTTHRSENTPPRKT